MELADVLCGVDGGGDVGQISAREMEKHKNHCRLIRPFSGAYFIYTAFFCYNFGVGLDSQI